MFPDDRARILGACADRSGGHGRSFHLQLISEENTTPKDARAGD
jgi:hypothetical protein